MLFTITDCLDKLQGTDVLVTMVNFKCKDLCACRKLIEIIQP